MASEWLEHEYLADFHRPLDQVNVHQGRTYGVQAEADISGLWFLRDHLEVSGSKTPTTWDQLLDSAHRASAEFGTDHLPIVMPGGVRAGEATTYSLLALLASNGAQVMDDRGVVLDDPRAVAALRFLRDLVTQGLLPTEIVGFDRDRPAHLLASGRATFMLGGSYQAGLLARLTGSSIADVPSRFGFIPIPAGPDGARSVLAGGMAYVVLRQGERPKDAMAFIERLLAEEPLAELAKVTAQIPPRREASEAVASSLPFVAETASMLEFAVVRPPIVEHARVSAQLQNLLTAVLTGTLRPATAVERTAEFIAAITGRPVVHPDSGSEFQS